MRVYNKDFVMDNLKFIIDQESKDGIKSFAVLGQENQEVQQEIQDLEKKSKNLENEKETLRNTKNEKSQENKLKEKAKEIKDAKIYTEKAKYDINDIKNDIKKINEEKINDFILSENKEYEFKNTLKDEQKENINFAPNFNPEKFQNIVNESKEILNQKIIPKENIENELRKWLNKGLELHENSHEKCKFCENVLTKERLDWLTQNLKANDEEKNLQEKLKELINNIENYKLKDLLPEKIKYENFYNQFKDKIQQIDKNLQNNIEKYNNELEEIEKKIQQKQENIYKQFELIEAKDYSLVIEENLKEIKKLCDENNQKTEELDNLKKEAMEKLRLSKVAKFIRDIEYFKNKKEFNEINKELEQKEEEIKNLNQQISSKKEELKDESRAANLINQYLKSFFGNENLRFKSQNENGKFKIYRNDNEAKNLSEGECSLLAFCYFIAKLEDLKTKDKKPIIWIDDPISSLDNNHIFFIFSLIENKIYDEKIFSQLFISTHNLEFLKCFKRKLGEKAMFLIEKENQKSAIKNMPNYMKNYVTEYNFLFEKIFNASENNSENINIDELYSLGNNVRKFLEIELFFKYPYSEDKYDKRFEKFFGEKAKNVKLILNKFSHSETNPEATMQIQFEQELKKICQDILEILKKDKDHYCALLESINKQEQICNNVK